MPNFLWVEDFPNDRKATVANVFGDFVRMHAFPEDPTDPQIKRFLLPFGIYVELTLSAAVRFIRDPDKLRNIDFIVLDIDLPAYAEIESEHEEIHSIISRWYGYKHGSLGTDDYDEADFQRACDELKPVAGYHLWAMLVVEMSFPGDRIIFCSNHGSEHETIIDSFKTAKIEPPQIFAKSDEQIKQWISKKASDAYAGFRRSVVETCDELLKLQPEKFRLTELPGHGADRLTALTAAEALDLWPSLLPFNPESSKVRSRSLRQFVGNIVHLWEAIKVGAIQKNKPLWLRSFADEMKFVRNAIWGVINSGGSFYFFDQLPRHV
jgi:hypothetical protein